MSSSSSNLLYHQVPSTREVKQRTSFLSSTTGALVQFGGENDGGPRRTRRTFPNIRAKIDLSHDETPRPPSQFARRQKKYVDYTHEYQKQEGDFMHSAMPCPQVNVKIKKKHKRHVRSITETTAEDGGRPKGWSRTRSERLRTQSQPHGKNILTWKDSHKPLRTGYGVPKSPKTRTGRTVSTRSTVEKITSEDRAGANRFYCPLHPNTASRQDVMRREGLPENFKKSSLLGIGRADLTSAGVRDAFDKSCYGK